MWHGHCHIKLLLGRNCNFYNLMKYRLKSCTFMSLHHTAAIKPCISVGLIETLIATSMRHWSAKHISLVKSSMSPPCREGAYLYAYDEECMCVMLALSVIMLAGMWEWQRNSYCELYEDVWNQVELCNISHNLLGAVCVRLCTNCTQVW